MSGARIRVSPMSTASTPTRSSSSSSSRVEKPDSDDHGLAGGHVGQQLVRALEVDREVGQVAVVEPDHVGLDVERHVQLSLVVDLHDGVEVEVARLAEQLVEPSGSRAATISRIASAPAAADS
jgi:hypothetical protein